MSSSSNRAPVLLLLLLVVLGGVGWLALGGEPAPPSVDRGLGPAVGGGPIEPARPATGVEAVSLPGGREGVGTGDPSTVLWPLEVDLVLTAPGDVPTVTGQPTLGSGGNARLTGRVGDRADRGAAATITFLHGANAGRVLTTDAEGRFGATDLYPGLSIVSIEGPGLVGAEREVRLRQRKETLLNIGFGRLGTVQGQVLDTDEEPVFGAEVVIDGHRTQTNEEGYFYLANLASGQTHVEISMPGYATHRERVAIGAGRVVPPDRLKYVLQPGATLKLTVSGAVGSGPVQVWLAPGTAKQQRGFPYYRLNPIELAPGEVRELVDLPRELLQLRAWRAGAAVLPAQRNVNLRASRDLPLTLELRDAPRTVGVVTADGSPVGGARVVLEAPDQVQAALRHFRQPAMHLESSVLAMPPNARQEVRTNPLGEFTLSGWDDGTPVRYLWAEDAAGDRHALRLVDADAERVDLELGERTYGAGSLTIDVGARYQGLPVTWRLNGQPGEPFELPPGEDLTFDGLRVGTWRVTAGWYADDLLEEEGVEVTEEGAELELVLPEGALNGQDRETWERADRTWPL